MLISNCLIRNQEYKKPNFTTTMKIRLLLTLIFVFTILSVRVFAQEITLTGTVVAQNQIPLAGASIIIRGTNNGTISDQGPDVLTTRLWFDVY